MTGIGLLAHTVYKYDYCFVNIVNKCIGSIANDISDLCCQK